MLKLDEVTKHFGDTVILKDASFAFPERGLVCVMGPSGVGKTTLLNLLAGFDRAYEGRILADESPLYGMDPDALCAYRRVEVGFVFQDYCLLAGLSARENVLMAAAFSDVDQHAAIAEADTLLARVGLGDRADQHAETLSGGQKQRVAIARALMGGPRFVFADEPTGALDRETSNEIMELLAEIAHERLVVVITHDEKLLPFADEVVHIEGCRLIGSDADESVAASRGVRARERAAAKRKEAGDSAAPLREECTAESDRAVTRASARTASIAVRGFRAHAARLIAVAAIISLGILAVLLALSCGNVERAAIERFKTDNPVYGNGYIKGADDGKLLKELRADPRVIDSYDQFALHDVTLRLGDATVPMAEKLPLPKVTESFSYGTMPAKGRDEIALTPSLAKKFAANIRTLLGKRITLEIAGTSHRLTVSGIYNAGYDDFFMSPDVERALYDGLKTGETVYAVSYDVGSFDDVVALGDHLRSRGYDPKDASAEVRNLQETFAHVNGLFMTVAALVCGVSIFLCAVLLVRLQTSRLREMGLLAALGFRRRDIAGMIRLENLMLASLSAIMSCALTGIASVVAAAISFPIAIGPVELASCAVGAFAVVLIVSALASVRLLRADPARALRG